MCGGGADPDRCMHLFLREGLQQPAQRPEFLGQSPALQRSGLVQSILIPWSGQYFADNTQLAVILISSNFDRYGLRLVEQDKVGLGHGRVTWVMESPGWYHEDVVSLGI